MRHNDKESWENKLRQLYAYFEFIFDYSRSSQIFFFTHCRLFWVVVSRCGFVFSLLWTVVGRYEPFLDCFGLLWVIVDFIWVVVGLVTGCGFLCIVKGRYRSLWIFFYCCGSLLLVVGRSLF